MKWDKLGKIFDPTQISLLFDCFAYAQSPQTIVFRDFVRIYFSTRSKDENNQYLSHIMYIDMDKTFKKIINVSSKTIINLGETGCFDEHGIFPINVLQTDDKTYAYTCGWSRRQSVPVETAIGLAISDNNGESFHKYGNGPILSANYKEPFLVGDPFVKFYDNKFHMWYIYGTSWKYYDAQNSNLERVYKIAYACSSDGISWHRNSMQIIDDVLSDECQALPTVIKIGSLYHMIFCYRQAFDFRKNPKNAYRLGYAFSDNGLCWQRKDESIKELNISTKESWDSDMMCYPHLFEMDEEIYLLYNGNEFGKDGFGLARMVEI